MIRVCKSYDCLGTNQRRDSDFLPSAEGDEPIGSTQKDESHTHRMHVIVKYEIK